MYLNETWQKNCIVFLLAAVFAVTGCDRLSERFEEVRKRSEAPVDGKQTENPSPPVIKSVHLAFGNPTNANENNEDNFLIIGEGSVISYNNSRGTANWISWKTTAADLGNKLERPDFRPDPRLPKQFRSIGYYDYSGSGFDRGHLVPSADRFADAKLNEETFMMTNIVPQTSALNQYPWNKLESYVRGQARKGFDIYQIAGVYGERERLKNKITVPANCWKVIIMVPKGKNISELDRRMRVIAVDMPNIDGIEQKPWESFKTTIRNIEQKTGSNLFQDLPNDVQDKLETKMEIHSISP